MVSKWLTTDDVKPGIFEPIIGYVEDPDETHRVRECFFTSPSRDVAFVPSLRGERHVRFFQMFPAAPEGAYED